MFEPLLVHQVGILRDPLVQSVGWQLHDQHRRAALASSHGRGPDFGAEDGETGAANQLGTDEDGGVSSDSAGQAPAMAQLGPYLAMAGSKRLDLGTSSSLDSKKPGRDCPKIQKSFEETTRGGFLEVLCGFVEVSSSVSTQFSTFLFSRSAGSYWWNDFFPCNPCWLWEPAMSWKVWRVVRRSWVAPWWERWTEPSGCPASSQAGQMVMGLW